MKYCTFIFLSLFLFSCESENEEGLFPLSTVEVPNDTTIGLTVSFQRDIAPLIRKKCSSPGCHAANSNYPTLLNYTQIEASKTSINGRVSAGTMPQAGPLPQNEKDLIATWITEGAKNN
jgi:hypothetical protein